MPTFHSAKDLANAQKRRTQRTLQEFKGLHQELANDMYQEAHRLTSGKLSRRQLAAMGHPYGRRSGSYSDVKTRKTVLGRQRKVKGMTGIVPALPINRQSGKLTDAIKLFKGSGSGKTIQTFSLRVLDAIAPYAKFVLAVGGTSKMVSRPFWKALTKFWKKKNFDLLVKMREKIKNG